MLVRSFGDAFKTATQVGGELLERKEKGKDRVPGPRIRATSRKPSLQHRLDVLLGCQVSKQPGCSSLLSLDPDPHCSLKQSQLNCH